MDVGDIEAAYAELLEAVAAAGPAAACPAPRDDDWDLDTVLAHVVATGRMLVAASAELLSGRVPVVDNRPTQSRQYLDAIVTGAGGRDELVGTVRRSAQELVYVAAQLTPEQIATRVPTIIVDGGQIRVQQPVEFSSLLGPSHLREHLEQVRSSMGGGAG